MQQHSLNSKSPYRRWRCREEIVAEIVDYQKVINGARAVLDHYRPYIPIHPDWPMVPLGDAPVRSNAEDFLTAPRNEPRFYGGKYPFYPDRRCCSGQTEER